MSRRPYCRSCGAYEIETSGPDHMPIYCRKCNSTDVFFPPLPPEAPKSDTAHGLFLDLVAAEGLPVPRSKTHPDGELMFVVEAAAAGEIPDHLKTESGKPRRWAFDYAWPDFRIAIERDGGVWTGRGKGGTSGRRGSGGHQGGHGQLRDMEKGNAAAVLGWRLLRYTPDQLCTAEPFRSIRAILAADSRRRSAEREAV